MHVRRNIGSIGLALVGALVLGAIVHAGSVTVSGVTLTWPEYPVSGPGFTSCEPWFANEVKSVTISGIPSGANVTVQFAWSALFSGNPVYATPISYSNVTTGTLVVPVPYPPTSLWPVWDSATNTKAIAMFVSVAVFNGSTTIKLNGKKWWVKCGSVPPAPYEGCTLGYWKNDAAQFDAVTWPASYHPTDDYGTVFGVTPGFTPHTLLDALNRGGGQEDALARQGTAALLNAAGLNFVYSEAQVIDIVRNAYTTGTAAAFTAAANTLAFANEGSGQGEHCPLDHGNAPD